MWRNFLKIDQRNFLAHVPTYWNHKRILSQDKIDYVLKVNQSLAAPTTDQPSHKCIDSLPNSSQIIWNDSAKHTWLI